MTTPIGRFLNALPDWVIPFVVGSTLLVALFYCGRCLIRRAARRRMWTPRRSGQMVVACLLAMLAIAWLFIDVVRPTYQAFRADGWRTADARVKRSRLFEHPHGGDPRRTTYSVDFLYAFVIDGQGYEGNRYDASVHFEADYGTKAAFARKYPPGTEVTVRYNPVDGDDSFLSTQLPQDLLDGIWFPVVALVVSLAIGLETLLETDRRTATPDTHPAGSVE